jgi:hypothetical protein
MATIYTDFVNNVLYGVSANKVTFPFGKCDIWVNGNHIIFHNGIDMTPITKVMSIEKGKVSQVAYTNSSGNYITLLHNDGFETMYKHLATGSILVKVGQVIDRQTIIATAGATGNVNGAHLHFEVRLNGLPIDPLPYLQGKLFITPYDENAYTITRPIMPMLDVIATQLNYRDKPNGNVIARLEVKQYPYTGHTEKINGYEWGELLLDDKLVYCALNPLWNTVIMPKQPLIPFNVKGEKDGQEYEFSLTPIVIK